jgi:site-specific recombinase XerD
MTPIAPHITAFLRERLPRERQASQHTCFAYAYTFQILFTFASDRLHVPPSDLQIEHFDAPLVLAFLDHIQSHRGNGPRTRNARLAAIKSFMRFVEHRVPSALDQVRRVLAVPTQRTDTRLVRHLSDPETRALLDAPDPTTRLGIRDRAMLYAALTGGLRVSELVGLRVTDIRFDGRYVEVRVLGKGRKERALLLWKQVGDAIRAWLAIRGELAVPEVFAAATGEAMTRSGFEYILRKHVATAVARCPSLAGKRVSPHVLRHTCALNTLQATGDLRKVALWLGHASQQTTEVYLQADPTEKIQAIEATTPPSLRPGRFRPPDRLIASLLAVDAAQPLPPRQRRARQR